MNRNIIAVLLSLCLCTATFHIQAQPIPEDATHLLDEWLNACVDYDKLPGIAVGIVRNQELVWSKGFGKVEVGKNTPINPNTIFSICSVSKLFTSVAIMKLRDEGKLSLEDDIKKHLPWFSIKQKYADSGPITIRTLLTHSSGIPSEADFPYWTERTFPSKEEIIKKLNEQQTLYPSCTYYQYSNLGMALLGYVIEQVSGVPYDTYIQDNILNPLKLADTRTSFPEKLWRTQMAVGYSEMNRKGERRMLNTFNTNGVSPAAGLTSTVQDLARFASWQFRLLNHGGSEIIKSSTLKEMQQVQYMDPNWKTTRGLGFNVFQVENTTYISHSGYCPGYQTLLMMNPKEKLAYIVMINANGTDPYKYFHGLREIVEKALCDKLPEKTNTTLLPYTGLYSDNPWGAEMLVTTWGDKLALVNLPSHNPKQAFMLIRIKSGDEFIRLRDDGEDGEPVYFERDSNNKIVKMWRHSNYRVKQR